MKNFKALTRAELKGILGGKKELSQFEPQDCYCTDGGNSFGCVTDAGCDSLTSSLCSSGQSICVTKTA